MNTSYILNPIIIGIGATLAVDAWHFLLHIAIKLPLPNYSLLGRWILYMPKGKFKHATISDSKHIPGEHITGWIVHYIVGIGLAALFTYIVPTNWLEQPTLAPALLYGFCTVILPLFIMQPAYGLGIAASKTSHPLQAITKSLATHIVFGFGLYLTALI